MNPYKKIDNPRKKWFYSASFIRLLGYHRDRGEPLSSDNIYCNEDEYLQKAWADFDADYLYLFADGKWLVSGISHKKEFFELNVTINQEVN